MKTTTGRRRRSAKKTAGAGKDDVVEIKIDDITDDVDPLAGLVEKTKVESGAPFAPEVLAAIST